jgi:tryptophan synthase alpha chain
MKNRIEELFAHPKGPVLSVFFTAGFPKLHDTVTIAIALEEAGVDLIEVGIPFSDPVADGPTIQDSNKVALENGISVARILEQVREMRSKVKLPIILMGYLNPVYQYGVDRFVREAAEAGADGFIFPDMPWHDYEKRYQKLFEAHGMLNIFLVAPTTSEDRIRKIDAVSKGFIYAVSSSSTTGARKGFGEEQLQYFKRLKDLKLNNPFLIGFGISDRDTFSSASTFGAGAIVGSAFINLLKESKDLSNDITAFVKKIKG